MFPSNEEFLDCVKNKKTLHGKLTIPLEQYPTWNDLIPYFDMSATAGNGRAQDYRKIFIDVKVKDFPLVRHIKTQLGVLLNRTGISCHCYAGLSDKARASPPHKDQMPVLFVTIAGSIPWKIFENGCDYDDKTKSMTSRSTFSRRLVPGEFVYIPKGIMHCAVPDCSRVGFSFGW